jgi:hypothetical protein
MLKMERREWSDVNREDGRKPVRWENRRDKKNI